MDFDITGHSGCTVKVIKEKNKLLVHKSTDDVTYFSRLLAQAKKQEQFYKKQSEKIKSPKILETSQSLNECFIKMEFVYSNNFIEFFENSGFDLINSFVNEITRFIDREVAESPVIALEADIFNDKYTDVKQKILSHVVLKNNEAIRNLLTESDKIFGSVSRLILPVGRCHGDLTFSNILFCGDHYTLIDFLDSFIETPLMDIVKLRQDTSFGWSFMMFHGEYDPVRYSITLSFIDKLIHQHFKKYDFYNQYYTIFQLMNFLRILQYAKDPKIIEFLIPVINQLNTGYVR